MTSPLDDHDGDLVILIVFNVFLLNHTLTLMVALIDHSWL